MKSLFGWLLLPFLSAFLLWSTLPPLDSAGNAWFALVPLLLLARLNAPGRAFRCAWLGGFAYWCASLFWFWRLIGNGGPLVLVILGQTLLAAYMGLYWALFAFASASLWQRARNPLHGVLLACLAEPLLWVGAEYVRGRLLSGFPWNFLGVSVAQNHPVIQFAAFGGVYAVSFLVMLANAGLASLVFRFWGVLKRIPATAETSKNLFNSRASILLSLLPLGLVICALFHGLRVFNRGVASLRDATGATHDVWLAGLVQPNTPSIFQQTDELVVAQRETLGSLTQTLGAIRPDFILWPESAVLGILPFEEDAFNLARDAATNAQASVIAGCLEVIPLAPRVDFDRLDTYTAYNALWHFDASGGVAGKYHKKHLVPCGEYIPGHSLIPALNKLTPGGVPCAPGETPGVFMFEKQGRDPLFAGPLICFEDLFPHISRASVNLGARVLLNATNDAWFEHSLEPEIHFRNAVFRAVENRAWLLRATSTGVTCAVDPFGRVERLTDSATGSSVSFPGFMTATLPIPRDLAPTFYTRHGDIVLAFPSALFLLVMLLRAAWRKQRPPTQKEKASILASWRGFFRHGNREGGV